MTPTGTLTPEEQVKLAVDHEFFPTPAWAVDQLLEHWSWPVGPSSDAVFLEPCVGDGSIIAAVRAHNNRAAWVGVDVHQYPWKENGEPEHFIHDSFLDVDVRECFDAVITNPPFSLAMEVLQKSLACASRVAMIVRATWFKGRVRNAWLVENPPQLVVVVPRPFGGINTTTGKQGTDSINRMWIVYDRELTGSRLVIAKY